MLREDLSKWRTCLVTGTPYVKHLENSANRTLSDRATETVLGISFPLLPPKVPCSANWHQVDSETTPLSLPSLPPSPHTLSRGSSPTSSGQGPRCTDSRGGAGEAGGGRGILRDC